MRALKSFVASILMALAFSAPALADAAGVAKGVDPQASAVLDNVARNLTTGSDIFLGDTITTGNSGSVQILFADNTKLVIGPNSTLTISDYLVRGDGSAGKLAINMLGGTFRFITGVSPKTSYEISTPTGTIGIRGTAFDAFIDENGIAYVLMYLGKTFLKEFGGDVETLTGLCEVGMIDDKTAEIVGNTSGFNGDDRVKLKAWFRYSLNQSSLLREFWLAHALECTHKPPRSGGPTSLLAPGASPDCPSESPVGRPADPPPECGGPPDGECSTGYHDESGTCVPDEVVCPTGYHNDGGTCVPDEVVCPTGYHNDGGTCVPDEEACPTPVSLVFVEPEWGVKSETEAPLGYPLLARPVDPPVDPCDEQNVTA